MSHRREYFADLYSASFIGVAGNLALNSIALNTPVTPTHPATYDRIQVVNDFLAASPNKIVTLFQTVLKMRGLRALSKEYSPPNVIPDFDDLRTSPPKSMAEVHGLFQESWKYLDTSLSSPPPSWGLIQVSEGQIEKIINDLTEKSIRNFAVQQAWNEASASL